MFGKIKKNYFLLITTFLFLYFFFNFLDGERGLFSYFKKKNLLINLQNEELKLKNKVKNLVFKNSLLTNNLDLDYIEILLRQKFLLGKKDEKFYIIKNHDN
jgi:cell division protein FtsB